MHGKMVPGFCSKPPWAGQAMRALLLMAGGCQEGRRLVRGSGRSHCAAWMTQRVGCNRSTALHLVAAV